MSEYIHVPRSLWGISGDISRTALKHLISIDRLPADFEFRALAIEDQQQRYEIALQDIRHAFGMGEPSGHPYLTQQLPDCMVVPTASTKSLKEILTEVNEDYHRLGTLLRIADYLNTDKYHAYQAWAGYIKYLAPTMYSGIEAIKQPGPQRGSFSKDYNFKSRLLDVVIKDSALMPIYDDANLINGHGPIKHEMLRLLLADNHPEIEAAPEIKQL